MTALFVISLLCLGFSVVASLVQGIKEAKDWSYINAVVLVTIILFGFPITTLIILYTKLP